MHVAITRRQYTLQLVHDLPLDLRKQKAPKFEVPI
jgi:hypothetical protein